MAILHYPFRRLRDKFFPESLPPAHSFAGRLVLVTGATTGLGYAAAVHFVKLGAEVIITSRTAAKGLSAKRKIEKEVGGTAGKQVYAFALNLDEYSSCVNFVEQLKDHCKNTRRLDCAVLNAGIVSSRYVKSAHGWEQTIQVNTLSTILLSRLLLPWMIQASLGHARLPHMVFVCSRAHLEPDISKWAEAAKHDAILHYLNLQANYDANDLRPNYDVSKLLLMYAAQELCKETLGPDGQPQLIISTVCPGLVHTDIGRTIAQRSLFWKLFIPLWLGTLGKSPNYGARTYVNACQTRAEDHGKFLQTLYTTEEYQRMAIPNLHSEVARDVQARLWHEITAELSPHLSGPKEGKLDK